MIAYYFQHDVSISFVCLGDSKHRAEWIGDLAIRAEKETNAGIAPVAQSPPSPAPNSSPPTQKTSTTSTITAEAQSVYYFLNIISLFNTNISKCLNAIFN